MIPRPTSWMTIHQMKELCILETQAPQELRQFIRDGANKNTHFLRTFPKTGGGGQRLACNEKNMQTVLKRLKYVFCKDFVLFGFFLLLKIARLRPF